jgi:hypothetical protein
LFECNEGPTQVVLLWHGALHQTWLQRRWCHSLAARPIESKSLRDRSPAEMVPLFSSIAIADRTIRNSAPKPRTPHLHYDGFE